MTDLTREILTIALTALINIGGAIILRYAIPALIMKMREWGVMKFVQAAEKKYGSGAGVIKREEVVALAKQFLPKMDEALLDALIESCCEQLDLMWAQVSDASKG